MLTSWRSEIRKDGISAVEALWDSDIFEYGDKEQHKDYAKGTLKGLNYLYKFPHQVVSAFSLHIGGLIMTLDRWSMGHIALVSYQKYLPPTSRRLYWKSKHMATRLELWL
jgi:hypothetical protein